MFIMYWRAFADASRGRVVSRGRVTHVQHACTHVEFIGNCCIPACAVALALRWPTHNTDLLTRLLRRHTTPCALTCCVCVCCVCALAGALGHDLMRSCGGDSVKLAWSRCTQTDGDDDSQRSVGCKLFVAYQSSGAMGAR